MKQTLHVFSGKFGTREKACLYSEEQWESPAPDDSWSDEAYSEWEDRNPSWDLEDELDEYLDSDFIETIFGRGMVKYLETQLLNDSDKLKVRDVIPKEHDTLVLIMSAAVDEKKVSFFSTSKLDYHGEYLWNPNG
ncbi:hypothetical protein [Pleionea sediminis]|uniref:hypothetical protein n=1 Tax=Pleionea sediminis TaxID=2569479 RepID=UPI0011853F68|nr:hypothetical protein [Pleionea sediminis]